MKNLRKLAQVNQRLNEAIQQMTLHKTPKQKETPTAAQKPEKLKPEARQQAILPRVAMG